MRIIKLPRRHKSSCVPCAHSGLLLLVLWIGIRHKEPVARVGLYPRLQLA